MGRKKAPQTATAGGSFSGRGGTRAAAPRRRIRARRVSSDMSIDGNGDEGQVAEVVKDVEDRAVDSAEQEEEEEDKEDGASEKEGSDRTSEKEGSDGDKETLAVEWLEYALECTQALAALWIAKRRYTGACSLFEEQMGDSWDGQVEYNALE